MVEIFIPAGTVVFRVSGNDLDPVTLRGDVYAKAERLRGGSWSYRIGDGAKATAYVVASVVAEVVSTNQPEKENR